MFLLLEISLLFDFKISKCLVFYLSQGYNSIYPLLWKRERTFSKIKNEFLFSNLLMIWWGIQFLLSLQKTTTRYCKHYDWRCCYNKFLRLTLIPYSEIVSFAALWIWWRKLKQMKVFKFKNNIVRVIYANQQNFAQEKIVSFLLLYLNIK